MTSVADVAAGANLLVFLAAVLGKLDRWGQWRSLSDEIPGPIVVRRAVRLGVPAAEGIVVVLTVISPASGLGVGAVVLLCFSLAVSLLARRLAGQECNCFGAIAPGRIGQRLAARNLLFALIAAAGCLLARHAAVHGLSLSKILVIVLCGVLALMLDQFRRLRRTTRILAQSEGG